MASLRHHVLRVLEVTSALAVSRKYDLLGANTSPHNVSFIRSLRAESEPANTLG